MRRLLVTYVSAPPATDMEEDTKKQRRATRDAMKNRASMFEQAAPAAPEVHHIRAATVSIKRSGPPRGQGRLSALRVFLCKSALYGAFAWARRALKPQKRRFPARAETRRRPTQKPTTMPRPRKMPTTSSRCARPHETSDAIQLSFGVWCTRGALTPPPSRARRTCSARSRP